MGHVGWIVGGVTINTKCMMRHTKRMTDYIKRMTEAHDATCDHCEEPTIPFPSDDPFIRIILKRCCGMSEEWVYHCKNCCGKNVRYWCPVHWIGFEALSEM